VRAFLLIVYLMKICVSNARLTAFYLAMAAAFSTPAAFSQTSATPQLKETVVTANRVRQDVQSAPFSAVVLTGEQILASGATDANEAIRRLVGIPSRTDLRGGRNYSLDLMGYGATADQNVVVIVDGVRISENELATARLSAISPEMIESIEIIRGGSSVQWGEGASAGLINVVLKKNVAAGVRGSASIQGESFGGSDIRAQLLGGNGTMGFDLNARDYKTDGYRDNSKNTQQTFSAGINGTIGGLGFRARVSTEDEKSRFPGGLTFTQYAVNPRQTLTPNDYGNFSEARVSAGVDYKVGVVTLALDVANRDRKSAGIFVGSSYNSRSISKSTQISPKLTYSDRIGSSALTVVTGLDFNNWDYNSVDNYGQNENAKQANNAAYLSADLLLPTGTRLTAGSRHERVNKRALDLANFVSYDRSNDLSAWDFGVNQALAAGLNVYARSAKAYRLPNVDENRYLATALRPQITRDLDGGLKWQSTAGSTVGIRAFRQNAVDEIAFDSTTFSNVNLDPSRRNGVELNGKTAITRDLSLSGSVQSITAKFSGGPNSGKEIPLISQMSAVLRIDWQLDARQRIGVGVQYLGEARFGNDNANTCSNKIPASTLFNARYAHKLNKLELSVAADNLSDNKTYSQAFSCSTGNLYPNPGRVVKLAAKYWF
jgi:iron complex outermembrane receptor protein